ncbi:energy-coupling factor transport system ATP-binding protein [Oribacterium sinus]|uniref:Energy-coupling factor transporter ATP-binding protein EcfA2 n=1 Tax=Oribacterium sinus TaxID=237576 RepID=A0A7W9W279_9FIRM|nr:energy-coupling factor transporter ATPase [Oribacterium sinus]MBB6041223.1 energy-coupling factor transport system ATP-binding protein [Oribacterium sinus]
MNNIEVKDCTYEYVRRDENDEVVEKLSAISHLNFTIEEGSFVCVLGHNGSGKSTLAKLFNALQIPTEGCVIISGMDSREEANVFPIREKVGMVFQNPDNQIIASVVEEDVGFGPENIGIPTEEIWKRVADALDAVNMEAYRLKSPNHLSGGQKQRVAIAGTLAMEPKTIVLDEPTAMLDPSGRAEVIRSIRELNQKKGITIILITHYMEETVDADRIILMDQGKLVLDGTPKEIFSKVEELKSLRMDVPLITDLAHELCLSGMPISEGILKEEELVEELLAIFGKDSFGEEEAASQAPTLSLEETENEKDKEKEKDFILKVENLSCIYQKGTAMESYALKDIHLSIKRGSFSALIGHTGSGKSTLLQHFNGLIKPEEGEISVHFRKNPALILQDKGFLFWKGKKRKVEKEGVLSFREEGFDFQGLRFKVGLVFQYPEYQLFEETVFEDVLFGPKNQGLSLEEARKEAEEALRSMGVEEALWQKSPFELSGGQKRRVAIAGVLAMDPELLILDEPTAGLDPAGREELFQVIAHLQERYAMTILLVSHSMDDVARYAEEVFVLNQGECIRQGSPEEVFSHKKEMEELGLGLPQIRAFLYSLEEKGLSFPKKNTVEEAKAMILSAYKKRRGGENA